MDIQPAPTTPSPSPSDCITRLEQIAHGLGVNLHNGKISAPCPACGSDDDRGLSIWIPKGAQKLGANCYSNGCHIKEIAAAIKDRTGIELNPLAKKGSGIAWTGKSETPYQHPDGREIKSLRFEHAPGDPACRRKACTGKHIKQEPKGDRSGFYLKLWEPAGTPASDVVVIVEGEKTAIAVTEAGYIAATYMGGTSGAKHANYSPVEGLNVLIWPDNDQPGIDAANAAAAAALDAGAAAVRLMDPVGGKDGADAADIPVDERKALIGAAFDLSEYIPPPPSKNGIKPGPNDIVIPPLPERVATTTADNQEPRRDAMSIGYHFNTELDMAGKLLYYHGGSLVIAYDSEELENPRAPELFVVTRNGLLTNSDSAILQLLADVSDRYIVLVNQASLGDKEFGACARHAASLKNAKSANSVRAQCYTAAFDFATNTEVVEFNKINRDLTVIGTREKGVFDIKTMSYLSPAEGRKRFVTKFAPYDYDPNAKPHPLIEKVFPSKNPSENVRYELSQMGYDITHPPTRHLVAHIAKGGTGKSTRKNLIQGALGKGLSPTIDYRTFQDGGEGSKGSTAHNGDILKLEGSRIAWVSESKDLDARKLNEASGGEDLLTGRRIYKEPQDFHPSGTLYIQANMPAGGGKILGLDSDSEDDHSAALRDRVIAVVFDELADPDTRIRDKAPKDPEAMRWLFKLLMEYSHEQVEADAPPEPPEGVEEKKQRLIQAEAPEWKTGFLFGCFRPQDDGDTHESWKANSYDAYVAYKEWNEITNGKQSRPVGQRKFTTALLNHYGKNTVETKYNRTVDLKGVQVSKRVDTRVWLGWMMNLD